METCFISLKDVNLNYPSAPYNALSFKEYVFKMIKGKTPVRLIQDVCALKNCSIEIREGDRVGIIGANGAGKSTLLKTMAGIFPLTSGEIKTCGAIRALYELSLGFEIEATGRENIMFRGLLLGEHPENVKAKEKEIMDFADLGEFIDYPVKSYSSGMQVRLAFSISTSIRGDIILLDEIISAGDAAFLQKAKNRLSSLIQSAKILVLVSHDLASIAEFCNRVIWLSHGQVVADGPPKEIISAYHRYSLGLEGS